jgi:S1-C subfamily serine protease
VVAVALVVALVAVGVALVARSDANRLRGRVAAMERATNRVGPLGERVGAAEGGINGLSRRVSDLEAAKAATPDTATVAQAVQRSVFTILSGSGEGSGWVVAPGKVVTNFHVIGDDWVNGRRDVTLRQDDKSYPGRVIEAVPAHDVAVIAFDGNGFSPLERAGDKAKVGDAVLALGSPLGLGGSVSSGIVSAYRTEDGLEYMQFSAPISPGNSGGPVVDAHGRVVGMSVAKFVGDGAEGLSFAIPVARVCDAIDAC